MLKFALRSVLVFLVYLEQTSSTMDRMKSQDELDKLMVLVMVALFAQFLAIQPFEKKKKLGGLSHLIKRSRRLDGNISSFCSSRAAITPQDFRFSILKSILRTSPKAAVPQSVFSLNWNWNLNWCYSAKSLACDISYCAYILLCACNLM